MHRNWDWPERTRLFRGKRGEMELTVRLIRPDEVDLVMNLQARVHAHMPDPSLLAAEDREQVEESVGPDACLGIFDGDRIIAFALMVANRESEERNTGQKNGYPPEECVSFDTAFVDPDYRGLGMQKYLLEVREQIARQMGAKRALVTVAPQNVHSLRNVQGFGFEVIARKQLYGGLDRYVLMKEL